MKLTLTLVGLLLITPGIVVVDDAQTRPAPATRPQVIREGGLVSVIIDSGRAAIIGEDGLVSIIGEDSLVIVVAPVDSRGAYALRGGRTGRVLQLTAGGSEGLPSQLRLGTNLTVNRRTAADAGLRRNGRLAEAELPTPCCEVVSVAKDTRRDSEPNYVVSAVDAYRQDVKFRFYVPVDGPAKFRVANGQKLSTLGIIGPSDSRSTSGVTSPRIAPDIIGARDPHSAWILLPSSAAGIQGRPKVYGFRPVAPER
jgi:hypothetical protein